MPGNIGDFKELVENSNSLFVDKSLFIQEIIDSKTDPLLITRPRRWGKTINMNMLFYFFVHASQLIGMGKSEEFINKSNVLFKELNIFKTNNDSELAKNYFRQYPTIFISFALSGDDSSKDDINKIDWNKIKGLIIDRIAKLFYELNYLTENLKDIIDKKFNQDFNIALDRKIAEYKKRFDVENLSDIERIGIYEQVEIDKSKYLEQQDLEKFIRFSRGELKNEAELYQSINFLAQLLHKFHKKPVYILIDEYDSLINKYFNQPEILNELTKTFSGIFSNFSKPTSMINDHIQKVIFTGILRVAKANIFSGLNNLQECTVLDEAFSKYYGFNQKELEELLNKSGQAGQKEDVMRWYNGYRVAEETIYNPWSVMQFITTKKLLPHWIDTANREIIKDIVLNNKGHAINKLLRQIIKNGTSGAVVSVNVKKSVSIEDLKNPESIWSFLIHTGYLTIVGSNFNLGTGAFKCAVKIPNTEVITIYNSIIRDWLIENSEISGMISTLFEQDYDGFVENVQQMLERKYDSAIFARQKNSVEEVYHSLLLAELNKDTSMERYTLLPEEPTGEGRADILLIDNKIKAMMSIELKRTLSKKETSLKIGAKKAVEQAMVKKYTNDEKYKEYKKLPAVGINFHGTNIALMVEGMKEEEIIVSIDQLKEKKTFNSVNFRIQDHSVRRFSTMAPLFNYKKTAHSRLSFYDKSCLAIPKINFKSFKPVINNFQQSKSNKLLNILRRSLKP